MHDEHCKMLWILATCDSRASTGAQEYVLCFPGWHHREVSHVRHMWMPVAHGLCRHQPMKMPQLQLWIEKHGEAHCDITREFRLFQRVLEVFHDSQFHPYHSILATASICLRWALFMQHFVDSWSMFYACCVFSVHNSHLWGQDNHAIHKHGYEVSIWAGISGDIVGVSAAWQAVCSMVSWFSGNCSTGAAWGCALTWKAEIVYDRAPAHCWEDVWQWLNMTYPGRWIVCVGLVACPHWLPDQTGFLLWGHQKKHVHAVASRTFEDLARLEAAVTAVDAIMLTHVWWSAVWYTAVCLEIDGGHFRHLL
jgi:hypothetical protein